MTGIFPSARDIIVRAVLVSEVVDGCEITIDGGGTTFSVAFGRVRFVTMNGGGSARVNTSIFPGVSGVTPLFANSSHFITINRDLTIDQSITVQEYPELPNNIQVGVVITANSTDPFLVNNSVSVSTLNIPGALFALQKTLRPLKREGCVLDHSSANDLTINTTEGKFLVLMGAKLTVPLDSNFLSIPDIDYVNYFYVYRDGSGGLTLETETEVQPDQYDDGSGTLVTMLPNRWSIQRVAFTDSTSCVIQYGQKQYNSLASAIDGLIVDPFEKLDALKGSPFLGYIFVRTGTTDLSDSNDAIFVNPPLVNGEFNVV